MKKNLIVALALVFVLGIASTAFAAANPFVDVPAKHWAYDAVSKLAQAGILDGYGDGTYRGERLATRYEMAQATAKAMARSDKANAQLKALIDKLAVEFAAELNNLGVRVAKLEKNASSIKFNGDSRLYYKANAAMASLDSNVATTARSEWNQRIRIYAKADVNDKATFYGRIAASYTTDPMVSDSVGKDAATDLVWDYGYFSWKNSPTSSVSIGRHFLALGQGVAGSNGQFDAIMVNFGDPLKVTLGFGDIATTTMQKTALFNLGSTATAPIWTLNLAYKPNADWNLTGGILYSGTSKDQVTYIAPTASTAGTTAAKAGFPYQNYFLGFTGKLSSDFTLQGEYVWNAHQWVLDNNPNDGHNAWMARLWFKGADKAKVGSWGMYVDYKDFKPYAFDTGVAGGIWTGYSTMNKQEVLGWGVKGWGFGVNYTFSKNAVLTATYELLNYNSSYRTDRLAPVMYIQANINF